MGSEPGREGVLLLDSAPPGARVYLDGTPVGETAISDCGVSFGRHVVRMEADDRDAVSADLEVTREKPLRAPVSERIMVCGGGAYNKLLMQRLEEDGGGISIESTAAGGLKPDWVEAVAFAWLAKMRLEERPGNIPEVTSAKRAVLLGDVFRASVEKR